MFFQFGIGEAAGLATACAWSVSCIVHTEASRQLGPTSMLIVRLPLAVLCLGVLVFFSGEGHDYPIEAILFMAASGVVGIAVCDWCFYVAIQRIGVRAALVCQSLYACMSALLGVLFLGDKLGLQGLAGIAVATCGVIMVITAESSVQGTGSAEPRAQRAGVLLALGSGFALAVGMVLSKEAMRRGLPPLTGGLVRTVMALTAIWTVNACTHCIGRAFVDLKAHPRAIWLLLAGCTFGTVGGLWLSLTALNNTATGVATVLMSMQLVILPFITWGLEHRRPAFGTLSGAAVACAGACIVLLR